LGSIIVGFSVSASYENSAADPSPAPRSWPRQSRIPFNDDDYTLVMFAHPRCPCTRASLGELARLVARSPELVRSWVVFFKPSDADESWVHTDQWYTASRIPGVVVLSDDDGAEARRFHATTSGYTLLYGPSRELLFMGGITAGRGQAGDNEGRTAIESLLANVTEDMRETPVYGCPIIVPSASY
jgi:hypothetical protein